MFTTVLSCASSGYQWPSMGTVTQTVSVHLLMSGNHHETLQFHILKSPHIPLILGYPWLCHHNPHINWSAGVISGWSSVCYQVCLKQAAALLHTPPPSGQPYLSRVPAVYHDFHRMFSRAKATSLPPYQSYDCAINLLLPGTSPPKGCLYSLSGLEREAMEMYINDSLAASIIRPSPSPAGASFLFVEKKDESLRPCIDYRGLNI